MGAWIYFFIGTPRRLLATCALGIVLFGLFRPDLVGHALSALLSAVIAAVVPFLQPVLTLVIIVTVAIWVIRRVFR